MSKALILATALIAIGLSACTDPKAATKALDDMGFEEVQTTGYRPFACGNDYAFHTGFAAKNSKGKVITGTVCSGWFFMGSAVKFD